MTKDQAVALARDFVRSTFPVVPPVIDVMHVTDRSRRDRRVLQLERWYRPPGSIRPLHAVVAVDSPDPDCWDCRGKWIVAFWTSPEANEHGMPGRLDVAVDDADYSVSRVE